jgi:CRP-like cAMP-binding protein
MVRKSNPVLPVHIDPGLHCSVDEQRRLLSLSPLFASLSVDQVETVQREINQTHYNEGDPIQFAGDPAGRLSIVARGTVKLVRPTLDGTDVLVDLVGPGQSFGSLLQLGDAIYREDATAQTPVCVLHINSHTFARLMNEFPAIAIATLQFVSGKLIDARTTIEELSAYPVEQRLAAALLRLADRVGTQREGDVLIELPLSRQDLADMIGSKVETVSRAMSKFRRAGWIDSGRRWIAVVDRDALAEVAEGIGSTN